MAAPRRRRPRRLDSALLTRIAFAWLVAAVLVAALAGCGHGGRKQPTPPRTTSFTVYFMRHGKVQPVRRTVPYTPAVARAALEALVEGPTPKERRELGVTSAVRHAPSVTVTNATARVDALPPGPPSAQIVYTLTRLPAIRKVQVGVTSYTRHDFEDETPQILVESPLPYQRVTSPLRARGTANTFEATFQYELRDAHGTVLKKHFVTATSGSGTRGTFEITVPFGVDRDEAGTLVVFENSAANGSRIHQVEIPLRLTR